MAQCRLAKTEDIGYALAIGEAIGDVSRVGILNLLIFVVIAFVIAFILIFIAALIARWNSYVGGVILGIVGVYLVFFVARATGLLYSNV
jgi:putative Mn2+ efflux pump MntP